MAKKTKEQKLRAEKNRLLRIIQENSSTGVLNSGGISVGKTSYQFIPSGPNSPSVQSKSMEAKEAHDHNYVKRDLRKIAVLAMLAFCAQLVLWYLVEKQLISLF